MSDTPNIGFTLLEAGQAQKEVAVNGNSVILDALLGGVISRTETAPPGSPAEGDAYIVDATATGVWAGHEDDIAYYFGGVWNFLPPEVGAGLRLWVQDEEVFVQYLAGSPPAWTAVAGGGVSSSGNLTADALVRGDDGAKGVQTTGVLVTDDNEISGYAAHVKRVTASTYTLLAADSGKLLELSDGTGVTLDLPNDLPKGWNATVVQWGAGAVTFDPEAGGTLVNRQSHDESAGQYAMCSLYVSSNSGTDAAWVLGGDTA